MDITGLTQSEIESMGSREQLIEVLKVQVDTFYAEVADEDLFEVSQIVGNDNLDEVMLELLYIVGVEDKKAKWSKDHNNARKITTRDVITLLAGSTTFKRLYQENEVERFRMAGAVVIAMEDILYDIELGKLFIGDDQFRSVPFCIIYFHFKEDKDLIPAWPYFALPLIEEPQDWTTWQNGGYHSSESKCTLNLGDAEQPQECLDILNILQHNTFSIHSDSNVEDYFQYKMAKGMKAENVSEALVAGNVINTLVSFEQTVELMQNKKFHFEWKFDFRGRAYNTAYNIALQGDKYQKGMILPSPINFKD